MRLKIFWNVDKKLSLRDKTDDCSGFQAQQQFILRNFSWNAKCHKWAIKSVKHLFPSDKKCIKTDQSSRWIDLKYLCVDILFIHTNLRTKNTLAFQYILFSQNKLKVDSVSFLMLYCSVLKPRVSLKKFIYFHILIALSCINTDNFIYWTDKICF